jgi:putative transposase
VIVVLRIVLRLLTDLVALTAFAFRRRRATAAEILVLRRQIALYQERGIKPRRIDPVTRVSLALLSRFFNWREALVVVRPETMIRWHRAGWKLFWRLKSRPGRPPIPPRIQALIRRMANENPSWGEERIANELLVKLYVQVSPRTVSKYIPKRPMRRPRGETCDGRDFCACTLKGSLPVISSSPRPQRQSNLRRARCLTPVPFDE